MKSIRIVQVVPDLVMGGAERFATWLAQAHLEAGHDAHVLCIRDTGPLLPSLSPELRRRTWTAGKRSRFDVSVLPRLVRALEHLDPDVVHTHLYTGLSWGAVAARLAGVPVVIHTQHAVHDDDHAYVAATRTGLSSLLDAVVGCSQAVVEDVERRGWATGCRTLAIDNGVPLTGRPVSDLRGTPLRVGTVGRLVPIKGQRYLIEAVALLRDQDVDVLLTIVGDGEAHTELVRQVEKLSLQDRVVFTGAVADVPERLAAFDLFVLPSLSEAMPMALIEAAAAGLPLLMTESGGGPTMLAAGAGGWAVPPARPEALAERIAEVAAMSPFQRRQLGEASREAALSRYSIASCAERYAALYRELLG